MVERMGKERDLRKEAKKLKEEDAREKLRKEKEEYERNFRQKVMDKMKQLDKMKRDIEQEKKRLALEQNRQAWQFQKEIFELRNKPNQGLNRTKLNLTLQQNGKEFLEKLGSTLTEKLNLDRLS